MHYGVVNRQAIGTAAVGRGRGAAVHPVAARRGGVDGTGIRTGIRTAVLTGVRTGIGPVALYPAVGLAGLVSFRIARGPKRRLP